jgi:hypothetical protein
MKSNNLRLVYLVALNAIFPSFADASSLTVKEAEARRNAIMQSQQSYDKKMEELERLKALIELNKEVDMLLAPPPKITPKEVEQKVEEAKHEIKDSLLQSQQSNRINKMKQLINMTDTGIYMSYFSRVANNVHATLIVNSKERRNIDVNKAIGKKRQFGDFIITGTDDRTLIVKNISTGLSERLSLQSPTEIKNKIAYEEKITRQYAEAILMGELNADLEKLGAQSTNLLPSSPLSVNYETLAPAQFDSQK